MIRPTIRSTLTVSALVVGLQACVLVVDTCACTRVLPGATVTGRVLDVQGAAIVSAAVEAWVRDTDCSQPPDFQGRVESDTAGVYTLAVTTPSDARQVCVDLLALDVRAMPPDSAWVRSLLVPVSVDYADVIEQDIRFGSRQAAR